MMQDYGTYNIADMTMIVAAANLNWIKCYLDCGLADWEKLMEAFLNKENLAIYIQVNFNEIKIPNSTPHVMEGNN